MSGLFSVFVRCRTVLGCVFGRGNGSSLQISASSTTKVHISAHFGRSVGRSVTHPLSLSLPPDSREETVLGSIPLPSYVVSAVGADDHISRKFAFKVCLLSHIFPFKMLFWMCLELGVRTELI